MTEELVICDIRIDEAAGRGDSDSRMTSFDVIMPLKLKSTKILKDKYPNFEVGLKCITFLFLYKRKRNVNE